MSKTSQREQSYYHLGKIAERTNQEFAIPKRFFKQYKLGKERFEIPSIGEEKRTQKRQKQLAYMKHPMTANSPYLGRST